MKMARPLALAFVAAVAIWPNAFDDRRLFMGALRDGH